MKRTLRDIAEVKAVKLTDGSYVYDVIITDGQLELLSLPMESKERAEEVVEVINENCTCYPWR